jgi:ABC-type uncharacterized transport system involved in gliding motility auxiliary subunit
MSSALRRGIGPAGLVLAIIASILNTLRIGPGSLSLGLFVGGCLLLAAGAAFNRRELWSILVGGGVRAGTGTTFYAAVIFGLVILVNFIANRHHIRRDLTAGGSFALSEQTRKVVDSLDGPVKIVGFFKKAEDAARLSLGESARSRLREYGFLSSQIQLEILDPVTEPGLATRYAVRQDPTIVVARGEKFVQAGGTDEGSITSAILAVTRNRQKKVLFMSGHGEKVPSQATGGYAEGAKALAGLGYEVGELVLSQVAAVPSDCDVLIVAGPEGPLLPEEEAALRSWLEGGGRLLALTEPLSPARLDTILDPWGLRALPMVIADRKSGLRGSVYTPIVTHYEKHPIVQSFGSNQTLFPTVGPVEWFETRDPLIYHETLARTGPDAWAESDLAGVRAGASPNYESATDHMDNAGLPIGVVTFRRNWQDAAAPQGAGESKEETRIVLFGDSDFASDESWQNQWNSNLFLNAVNWLAQEEVLIGSRQAAGDERALVLSHRFVNRSLALLVTPPIAVALAGLVVWWRRRKL